MKLKLQQFIEENKDWENILSQAPYCLSISKDIVKGHELIMFKYNQVESDFNNEIVRECRGLILDANSFEPICIPFFKFGNYGESYCPEIDWKNCWVGQKLDGSLIKMVKLPEGILISTNGTINAFNAPLVEQLGCAAKNFGELVLFALQGDDLDCDKLYEKMEFNKSYMFELTSPFNKVVVPYKETKLNFLGCRDNISLKEEYFSEHEFGKLFNVPKVFPLRNVDECIKAANLLGADEEGYVVCDINFNRVKVKSPLYVSIHHMRSNDGVMSYRRALEVVKKNEVAEVLNYFPEYKDAFDELSIKFNSKVTELESVWNEFVANKDSLVSRKDQAIWLTSRCKTPGLLFKMLDGKISSIHDGLYEMPNENILKMLELKE